MPDPPVNFDLSRVFRVIAYAIPDSEALVWRHKRLTYSEVDARADGIAHYLHSQGLGSHTERHALENHRSGQDHLGVYLRNGNEYLETMIGGFRARVAPFNVSYRYVADELVYLLADSGARALVYSAEFAPRVAEIRDRLPELNVLVQVADDSGNALLPGAVDYEAIVATPPPSHGMPAPSGDDLYIIYTGGTTGMPKGVLWRQHDIFVSAMGGRPFGGDIPMSSYHEVAAQARRSAGSLTMLLVPPLMHGAAQWAAFTVFTLGGRLVFPDDVERMRPADVLRLAEREKVITIPTVGDAIARPLIDEIEAGDYELSSLLAFGNGGAPLSPTVRERILRALPHVTITDAVGSSEGGAQMSSRSSSGSPGDTAVFAPQNDTAVVADTLDRVLRPGEGEGWLARRDLIPLGYLGDAVKTAKTFPTIDGVRWSVPGDRARYLDDGRVELLGRDSVTINTGGEKVFAEEVERAVAAHPAVYDVVVCGRPSQRWGSEVVAIVQFAAGKSANDDELAEVCGRTVARYKVPKAFIRVDKVQRSPAGKADYRWAKDTALQHMPAVTTA